MENDSRTLPDTSMNGCSRLLIVTLHNRAANQAEAVRLFESHFRQPARCPYSPPMPASFAYAPADVRRSCRPPARHRVRRELIGALSRLDSNLAHQDCGRSRTKAMHRYTPCSKPIRLNAAKSALSDSGLFVVLALGNTYLPSPVNG